MPLATAHTVYLNIMYGLGIAVVVTLLLMLHESWLDLKAARAIGNSRLSVVQVRLARELTLLVMVAAVVTSMPSEIRRLAMMVFLLTLALSEVYLRRAVRHSPIVPARLIRLWESMFGPRE